MSQEQELFNYFFQKSLDFIRNPGRWPRWPLLPVVRRQSAGGPDTGLILAEDKAVVYLKNLYSLKDGPLRPQLEDVEKHEYASFEELVGAGWEVD